MYVLAQQARGQGYPNLTLPLPCLAPQVAAAGPPPPSPASMAAPDKGACTAGGRSTATAVVACQARPCLTLVPAPCVAAAKPQHPDTLEPYP